MSWIYTHDNLYCPKDSRPLVRAWNLETGKVTWEKDFSEFGSGGNDSGLCLMDARECVAAVVSNGRIFYTSQSSGMQVSQVYGAEAAGAGLPW